MKTRTQDTLHIGVGDLVEVRVFDTPELSSKQRVDSNGAIEVAVAGSTPVAGMTPEEAARVVEGKLKSAQIMLDPHVTLFIADYASQSVSVLGEVRNPGNFLLLGPHSLYSALSAAGGTTDKAGATITITHRADPQHPQTVEAGSSNDSEAERLTEIVTGDIVFVSRADSIYVVGDVHRPGQFPLLAGRPLNALNAMAMAEGSNASAALRRAVILRKTETGTSSIPVDLTRVAQNREANPNLRPEDILVIPHDGKKAFLDATLPGLTGALAGSAMAALVLVLSNR